MLTSSRRLVRFRCDFQGVAEIEGWKGEIGGKPVVRLVDLAPSEGCHQVPTARALASGRIVAVGGDALAVENHLHGRVLLVYEDGMVRTVVEKGALKPCVSR